MLPGATALSLLSTLGALGSLAALAWLVRKTAPGTAGATEAAWRASSAASLLAVSPIFVRHAGGQEVYALQLGAVLAAAVVAASRVPRKHALAGCAFGAALSVHNGSVFLAPAMAFLVAAPLGSARDRGRALAAWAVAAAAVVAIHYAVLAWLLPPPAPGATRVGELLTYLRGLPPALDLAPLTDPRHTFEATGGVLARLTDAEIPVTRGPAATGTTGLSSFALAAAAVGLVLQARRSPAVAAFFALWATPFLVYEIALGWNLDYGVYLVFLLPPAVVLAAEAAWWPAARFGRAGAVATAVVLVLLAVPAALRLQAQWPEPGFDRLRHDSAATLAARWAAESLPADAVIVQPRSEWNANLLPLYAKRRHVARSGGGLKLFEDRGSGTPMRPDSYRLLDTKALRELLDAGVPVFAFEPDPLRESATPGLDPARFAWRRVAEIDLADRAKRFGAARPARFERRLLGVYQASRPPSGSGASEPISSR